MPIFTEKPLLFSDNSFRTIDHLLAVVNDILDMSKLSAGKMTVQAEPLKLGTVFFFFRLSFIIFEMCMNVVKKANHVD